MVAVAVRDNDVETVGVVEVLAGGGARRAAVGGDDGGEVGDVFAGLADGVSVVVANWGRGLVIWLVERGWRGWGLGMGSLP